MREVKYISLERSARAREGVLGEKTKKNGREKQKLTSFTLLFSPLSLSPAHFRNSQKQTRETTPASPSAASSSSAPRASSARSRSTTSPSAEASTKLYVWSKRSSSRTNTGRSAPPGGNRGRRRSSRTLRGPRSTSRALRPKTGTRRERPSFFSLSLPSNLNL